ncbi:MAG: thioredoxin domain-containing protein [Calothrix sp. MO_167.B42]|nr:thioredoxin domain-containing protein [Calothrix sp. MO_167.B42]
MNQQSSTGKRVMKLSLVATLGMVTILTACGDKNTVANVEQAQTTAVTTKTANTAQAKPLAQELQGKPVVVDIFATWCAGCRKIKPALDAIKKDYGDTASFVVLDVTDKGTTEAAQAKAEKLGLQDFFATHKSKTATVGIIDPSTGEVLKLFQKNPNKGDYVAVLDTAIGQIKK